MTWPRTGGAFFEARPRTINSGEVSRTRRCRHQGGGEARRTRIRTSPARTLTLRGRPRRSARDPGRDPCQEVPHGTALRFLTVSQVNRVPSQPAGFGCSIETGSEAGKVSLSASSSAFSRASRSRSSRSVLTRRKLRLGSAITFVAPRLHYDGVTLSLPRI
jgi:hypothetical protein